MSLKWHLLIRMTLLGLLCWAAVSLAVIASAASRTRSELEQRADRLAQHMELDLAWQMTAAAAGERSPELSRIAAAMPEPLCIRYVAMNGREDEHGCETEPATRAHHRLPRWLAGLIPVAPTLERPVRLWGQTAGTARFTPDPQRLFDAEWNTVRKLSGLAALTIIALDALVFWMIGHALSPTRQIVAALDRLAGSGVPAPEQLPRYQVREFRDISDGVRQLALRLKQASDLRDQLTSKLIRIQEDERRELTHALHEEVGQSVAATAVAVALLRMRIGDGEAMDENDLEEIDQTVEQTQVALRSLLLRVRPPLFEQQGLVSALNDLITGWRARLRGRPQLHLATAGHDLAGIGGEQALCLYRVMQECLSNIARHAGDSQRAEIALHCGPRGVEARVSNDVPGDRIVSRGSGMGLQLLEERLRSLGGCLEIQATASRFDVCARLPAGNPA
ncbi:sensor histidine kinase [Hydrocarboniphaga effusa]|uniref:sensor histidine kinase n=1 Tax=Hydrocarboniphaga effusa TaxID=243629 RepID=UPI003BAC2059